MANSYRSPLLDLPGAVPGEPPDEGVALHYGDPFAEQRRLESGVGYVDLSHREVVRVSGPDRLSWLHSLTTQHLTELPPGQATEALVLSPHGHIEHALYLVDDGEATWMHVEPGTAADLVSFLDKMRFMLRVEVADVTAEWALIWEPVREPVPGRLTRVTDHGRDVFLPRGELAEYGRTHEHPAGMWAYEALRIARHQPRLRFETDHRTIPHEAGWIDRAVHLDKGCYRGQETVARVHFRGRPPRRLVFLHLDGSVETLPPHGAPVEYEGRQVGFVTSSARHYELGPIALALIKRNTPIEVPLLAGGVAASQEVIVPA
ncbi:folate-binding protein [Carbonactinospora thermoautotrophica]|uniref:Folate-binding protein n=1 Tax=Carbonactinospora thermoautotrophica TaxID=1469144 RepID=A0A132MJK7_9ACTN|nr:glycine cleavage T C-terminal barrel domain-containing protein [Carbonactinospora thermoautotrophica]KWW98016.1 folate-binding protein [Carbonactinospora thermoautotrophica]KWX09061.1 folate-binding protein [Carbonactinospora thermoautotrophica]